MTAVCVQIGVYFEGPDGSLTLQIQRVRWADRTVAVDLTREALKQAPWYDPAVPLGREMEIAVYKHYGRGGYWPGTVHDPERAVPHDADA
jgi:hypothetical protein